MNDTELRAHLRAADPAAVLAPMTPDQYTRLMEEAMTHTSTTPRRPWRVLAAAAAVLVVAAGGWLFADLQSARPQAPATPAPAIQLTAGSQLAKCRAPEASVLAGSADVAFAATVAAVSDQTARFTVTRVFRGEASTEVELTLDGSSESLMGGSVTVGAAYLIAATDGSLLGCGYSGTADTPGLAELYRQAFGG